MTDSAQMLKEDTKPWAATKSSAYLRVLCGGRMSGRDSTAEDAEVRRGEHLPEKQELYVCYAKRFNRGGRGGTQRRTLARKTGVVCLLRREKRRDRTRELCATFARLRRWVNRLFRPSECD